MNAKALRIGIKRGWTEHTHLLKTRKELVGTLLGTVGVFAALTLWMGDSVIEGTGVSRLTFLMVGFLAYTVFGTALMTLPMALVADREEGTLLRLRTIPGGILAYLAGRATTALCQIAVQSALIVATGVLLGGAPLPHDWLTLAWVLLLGTVATVPLGAAIGSVLPSKNAVGIATLPMIALMFTSGVFFPATIMPEALQWIAQTFPLYWQGLGLRAAFLPDTMLAAEIAGSWRLPYVAAVLAAWTAAGMLLAPPLIRRVTRRESGSRLAARQLAAQRS
ncbi:transport permease protein [Planobispora rosea]|uniref:Transport permease protein n=1 Tax=Planobispora rosea TaxID=35762 RepID=A0A8J3S0B1_PLARO|nr:ABC transporter permease [Planobispora rosea]GGS67577.1 transport permease protein [Planobispora rosea]GIH85177.1 transport permease protein [Planobispora rosea]